MLKTVCLAAVLLIGHCVAQASDLPSYPFVHVTGKGIMRAMPDLGEIDFEITAHDADPAQARVIVEARIAEIRALMAELALPAEHLLVRDVRMEMRRVPGQEGAAMVLYDVKCGVHIEVHDLSKWKGLVAPLIDKPNLDGFMTAFDLSGRTHIENELIGDAIRQARDKAIAITKGIGRRLGPVTAVTNGELKNLTYAIGLGRGEPERYRSAARAEIDRDKLVSVSMIRLAQDVDMIFAIK